MKFVVLASVWIISLNFLSYAQTINGIVKDSKTNEPLGYVNVGVLGKAIGTVTGDDGHFSLVLNNNNSDTLKISMIGYAAQTFLIRDFIDKNIAGRTISLSPVVNQLAEVKISGQKLKEAVLGNTTQSKSTDAGFTSNKLGNEIGEIIKIKRSPTLLKKFNASLARDVSDYVKLRLNFYSVKNDLPDKIIQKENIFLIVKKGMQNISVDLTPYKIVVEDKFFVSLECIQDSRGNGIMFSATLLSSPIISRETSQANWEKVGLVGIGFNVLAAY